jgi:hypothetical protein
MRAPRIFDGRFGASLMAGAFFLSRFACGGGPVFFGLQLDRQITLPPGSFLQKIYVRIEVD